MIAPWMSIPPRRSTTAAGQRYQMRHHRLNRIADKHFACDESCQGLAAADHVARYLSPIHGAAGCTTNCRGSLARAPARSDAGSDSFGGSGSDNRRLRTGREARRQIGWRPLPCQRPRQRVSLPTALNAVAGGVAGLEAVALSRRASEQVVVVAKLPTESAELAVTSRGFWRVELLPRRQEVAVAMIESAFNSIRHSEERALTSGAETPAPGLLAAESVQARSARPECWRNATSMNGDAAASENLSGTGTTSGEGGQLTCHASHSKSFAAAGSWTQACCSARCSAADLRLSRRQGCAGQLIPLRVAKRSSPWSRPTKS